MDLKNDKSAEILLHSEGTPRHRKLEKLRLEEGNICKDKFVQVTTDERFLEDPDEKQGATPIRASDCGTQCSLDFWNEDNIDNAQNSYDCGTGICYTFMKNATGTLFSRVSSWFGINVTSVGSLSSLIRPPEGDVE